MHSERYIWDLNGEPANTIIDCCFGVHVCRLHLGF